MDGKRDVQTNFKNLTLLKPNPSRIKYNFILFQYLTNFIINQFDFTLLNFIIFYIFENYKQYIFKCFSKYYVSNLIVIENFQYEIFQLKNFQVTTQHTFLLNPIQSCCPGRCDAISLTTKSNADILKSNFQVSKDPARNI